MAAQQHQLPNVRTYKCPTNTSHQTRFSSSKTFQKASRRSNCLLFFPSWSPIHWFYYLIKLFFRYPNLHEVRLIPTKRDIAFVEFLDEGSAGVAKDALHNYKLDGENKIKVHTNAQIHVVQLIILNLFLYSSDYICEEVGNTCTFFARFIASSMQSLIFDIRQTTIFALASFKSGAHCISLRNDATPRRMCLYSIVCPTSEAAWW